MKSGPLNCGGINLKGKKFALLSCRCCACVDLRDKQRLQDERRARIDRYHCETESE